MELFKKKNGKYLVVRVGTDRIDATNFATLKDSIFSLVEEGENKIVVDLSGVSFMDSSGLAGLLPIIKQLPVDGHMLITGLCPRVEQLFKLTKLDSIFDIFPSVEEALVYEEIASGSPS